MFFQLQQRSAFIFVSFAAVFQQTLSFSDSSTNCLRRKEPITRRPVIWAHTQTNREAVNPPPHHTFKRVLCVGSPVQQLAVLQLLAQPLQGVERLVELHRHRHFGEVFADVVPEDVPKADGAAAGAQRGQTGATLAEDGALVWGQSWGDRVQWEFLCAKRQLIGLNDAVKSKYCTALFLKMYLNFVCRSPSHCWSYP